MASIYLGEPHPKEVDWINRFYKVVAFYEGSANPSMTLVSGVLNYDDISLDNLVEVSIGNKVTEIGEEAFAEAETLTSVTIADSVKTMNLGAFANCPELKNVHIGKNLSGISQYVFYGCASLSTVNLPESLKSIDKQAFYQCYGLESVKLPDGLVSIGDSAFRDSGIKEVALSTNDNILIDQYAYADCPNLSSVSLVGNFTFKNYAFATSGVKTLTLDGMEILPQGIFMECSSLTSVRIPDTVTIISAGAFQNCTNLTEVIIGNSVEQFGGVAFAGCPNLLSVVFTGDKPTFGGQWNFGDTQLTVFISRNKSWINPSTGAQYQPGERINGSIVQYFD